MFTQKPARRRWRALLLVPVLALAALFSLGAGGPAGADSQDRGGPAPTIVLVHGDWADGSSWTSVIERLAGLTSADEFLRLLEDKAA